MRVLFHLLGSVAFAVALSDIWARSVVPLGAVPVPPFSVFGILVIVGLFRIAFRSDRQLIDMGKEQNGLDSSEQIAVLVSRYFALAFAYGLFRIAELVAK